MDSPLVQPLAALARKGIFIGTSSWKYPGWLGQIYHPERYLTHGKFSGAKFTRDCLEEYAQTFPTVCIDAGYYKFPTTKYLDGLASQVPAAFKFSIKVTDEITVKHFPKLPRFGKRKGTDNPNFLNADLFLGGFLEPVSTLGNKLGVVIFEFSRFYPRDFERGRDFVAALEPFLARLPTQFQYAIEMRNRTFLHPDYFALLAAHNVAHVYNQWTRTVPVQEQLAMPGSRTADFATARFLLREGRPYKEAVEKFSPYNKTLEEHPEARAAAAEIIHNAQQAKSPRPSFVYVNNRMEGNAPNTIGAITGLLTKGSSK